MNWLMPLSWFFDGVTRGRNWLFDHRVLPTHHLPCFVISVGNLSVGGTGKTPITDWIVSALEQHQTRTAVLSRGYGGHYRGRLQKVEIKEDAVKLFGDEPVWLARQHPRAPIFVGRDRVVAGQEIVQRMKPQVLILDDAFQHRWIARNLNIVVMDVSEDIKKWSLLPAGRGRENFYALKRADMVILNKCNLTSEENVRQWQKVIAQFVSNSIPVWRCDYGFSESRDLSDGKVVSLAELKGKNVVALSGLARPENFEQQLKSELELKILRHLKFRDHHLYSDEDLQLVATALKETGAQYIVTTEKDSVRINPHWLGGLPLLVMPLRLKMDHTSDEFYEMVRDQIT